MEIKDILENFNSSYGIGGDDLIKKASINESVAKIKSYHKFAEALEHKLDLLGRVAEALAEHSDMGNLGNRITEAEEMLALVCTFLESSGIKELTTTVSTAVNYAGNLRKEVEEYL